MTNELPRHLLATSWDFLTRGCTIFELAGFLGNGPELLERCRILGLSPNERLCRQDISRLVRETDKTPQAEALRLIGWEVYATIQNTCN